MFRMKYSEHVILGAVRTGIEVSEFGHHFRLKAEVGLHFQNREFMYVKSVMCFLLSNSPASEF